VRKFAVIPGNFSIDAGQLTPTMKLRRKAVIEAHRELVESLYAGD
jgi:long-chain acyl-CoA synthetase